MTLLGQPVYEFETPAGVIKKTLAPPTAQRMAAFLEMLGKKTFEEVIADQGKEFGMFVLNLGLDADKVGKMLEICLVDGAASVSPNEVDLRIVDSVVTDFFEQRSRTLNLRKS